MIRSPSSSTKELNQHECSFLSLTLWLTGGGTGGRKATIRIDRQDRDKNATRTSVANSGHRLWILR